MKERDKRAVADVLEQVLSQVAETEFYRLTQGLNSNQRLSWVGNATSSLNGLRSLRTPNYTDPLVALFYALQYQLTHINMAFSIIEHFRSGREGSHILMGDTGALRVVDFGCGSLAMNFGVTLAVADSLDRGHQISDVTIDSIDNSPAMIEIGLKLWHQFTAYVNSHFRDSQLSIACGMVQEGIRTHSDVKTIVPMPGADNWLTALHVVYRSNENDVRRSLRHLYDVTGPVAGVVTCYYNENPPEYGSARIARIASPFPETDLEGLKIRPELPTSPQSATNAKLAQMCQEWGFFPSNFRQIFWGWKFDETAFLMYAPNNRLPKIVAQEPASRQADAPVVPQNRETETPPAPKPVSLAVGDRVQTGIGNGRVDRLGKRKVRVILDNGLNCEVPASELKLL